MIFTLITHRQERSYVNYYLLMLIRFYIILVKIKGLWSIFYLLEHDIIIIMCKVGNYILWIWTLFQNTFGYFVPLSSSLSHKNSYHQYPLPWAWGLPYSIYVSRLTQMMWSLKNYEIIARGLHLIISKSIPADTSLHGSPRGEQEVWQ